MCVVPLRTKRVLYHICKNLLVLCQKNMRDSETHEDILEIRTIQM